MSTEERVFKALADGRRRRILDLLKSEPRTTGELCAKFRKLDRCTVMQHLGVLEKAEVLHDRATVELAKLRAELAGRARLRLEQVEDPPPPPVRQRLEHPLLG